MSTESSTSQVKKYSMTSRLALEAFIGYCSGAVVAPFVTIVDKGIVQNASGQLKLVQSIKQSFNKLFTQPISFLKSPEQLWLFCVYSNTYLTNNCIEGYCKQKNIDEKIPKFWGVFLINMGLSITKDRALVRLFGTSDPKPVPTISFGMWALRDSLTVFCAFIMPPLITKFITKMYNTDQQTTLTTVTFWCPILLQAFSSPLHLLGLDYYNNIDNNFQQRMAFLKREYLKSTFARMLRMTPAYGLGGVFNLKCRQHFFPSDKKL